MEKNSAERVLTVLTNCSTSLRRAHSDLSRTTAQVDALAKISGVADALDAIVVQVSLLIDDNEKYRRTTGGLSDQVRRLRNRKATLVDQSPDRL